MGINVLVTGGAGYIGSILVPALLGKGYSVTVLDNLLHKQRTLLECCGNKKFDFIKGDICDHGMVNKLLPKHDIVMPLAAIVGAPACKRNQKLAQLVNIDAHLNVVKNVAAEQLIVFPMTNSGYGVGEAKKFCTESTPLRPISDYGKAKVEIEKAFLDKGNAITYRLATVFGMSPRMRLDLLVNDFVHRALRDRVIVLFEGHFRRNFIHVRDVASAFLFGIDRHDHMRGEAFNVGLSTANLSKEELCEKIRKYLPHLLTWSADVGEDPDKRDYIVSNEKIESMGWSANFSLDDGIRELIKGFDIIDQDSFSNA